MHSVPDIRGWQFIGPQNVTGGSTGSLEQHLGRIHSIIVNSVTPSEVYVTDEWGGLWKTTNADLVPNNTWTCLSDNLVQITGIGITNVYVDFSSTPHHLFCLAGIPWGQCIQNNLFYDPHTIGVFYSLDDGATFSQMDISATGINLTNDPTVYDPILSMKYWPGNATSGAQYLFLATKYHVFRLDITDPTAVTSTTIIDITPLLPGDFNWDRFRGFGEIGFMPSDPTVMYVTTNSNDGQGFSATAGLYRIPDCNCTSCTSFSPTNIPFPESDYLNGKGDFTSAVVFPDEYGSWWTHGWVREGIPKNYIYFDPSTLSPGEVASVETAVDGSYFDELTYHISFKVVLPPHTQIDVVLKDVNSYNMFKSDWATGITSVASGATDARPSPYSTNFDVGPGFTYDATGMIVSPTPGHYMNNGPYTQTITVTPVSSATVTATHFVDRLEFGAHTLADYTGGDVILDDVIVSQPFQKAICNLATTSDLSASNYLYCITAANSKYIQKIVDIGTPYVLGPPIAPVGDCFQLSAINPDIIYGFNFTNHDLSKTDISDPVHPVTTYDGGTGAALHTDGRSLCLVPNSSGTEDIYFGNDGGIAVRKYGSSWKSLNGIGLNTSLDFDIGSSIHTGEVGIAATDNHIMVSNQRDFAHWSTNPVGDGGQVKYGKRYITRNLCLDGYSGSGGFATLSTRSVGSPICSPSGLLVGAEPLAKVVTTYNGEYVGQGIGQGGNIYRLDLHSGLGTPLSHYHLGFTNLTPITITSPANDFYPGTSTSHQSVQAIAPDLFDPSFIAAHIHTASYDQGGFLYCENANTSSPTWDFVSNNPSDNPGAHKTTDWHSLICMAADPRSVSSDKRLWVGSAAYGTVGIGRVFQTKDRGATWYDVSYGLPDGPVNVLAYDEQSHFLFAGTDQGIYAWNVDNGDNGSDNPWICYSLNLPNSFVTGLDINRCTGKIYASTYGRGAYEADLPPAWNWNGTSYAGGANGIYDFCDLNIISGTITWTEDKDEMRSIYIGPGNILVIKNCTVNMGRNKNIIVDIGGTLIVEGGTITNSCGVMWGGINVLGDPTMGQDLTHAFDILPHSDYQGIVRLRPYYGTPNRNPVIENAYYGIMASAQYYDGSDIADMMPGGAGGLVLADRATFHNCATGIYFGGPYASQIDHSYVSDCHFVADAPLQNTWFTDHTVSGTPRRMGTTQFVNDNQVWGVTFWNDTFETVNNTSIGFAPDIDIRGAGITSFNASVHIEDCRFRNLTRGILSTGIDGAFNTHVYGGQFSGCWRSVSADIENDFICHKTKIITGPVYPRPSDYQPLGVYYEYGPFGTSAASLTLNTFHISENVVTSGGTASSIPDYGFYISAGPLSTLYRNQVHNTSYGVENHGGFQVKCNKLFPNTGSCAAAINSFSANTQGTYFSPPSNLFSSLTSSHISCHVPGLNYYSDPMALAYKPNSFSCSFPASYPVSLPNGVGGCHTTSDNYGTTNCCPQKPATFRVGAGGNAIAVSTAASYISLWTAWISDIEAGMRRLSSPAFFNLINDTNISNAALTDTLMENAPVYSDSVLIAVINRVPQLSDTALKAVLLANSALSYPVFKILEIERPSLAADSDIVNAQDKRSMRNFILDTLLEFKLNRNEYVSALKRYYDSTSAWDSSAQLYASLNAYELAFAYYMRDTNWAGAQDMIDSLTDSLLTTVMAMQLSYAVNHISIDTLSTSDSTTLATMSLDRNTRAGEIAYVWYTHAYGKQFVEYMPTIFMDSTNTRADTTYHGIPKGVLAVTEFSQGPVYGCQYAELIVANCGGDTATCVNIQGWLIDDNDGIFTAGLCNSEIGISPGHYRLAQDSVWAKVPVGSVIVMYNHDNNCYNLPDTFTLDSASHIYWIPIGGTQESPYGNPHVEMYTGIENSSICSPCSDTGTSVYTTAADWLYTIGLDTMADGVQALCPGCSPGNPGFPLFYYGMGYWNIDSSIFTLLLDYDTSIVNMNDGDTITANIDPYVGYPGIYLQPNTIKIRGVLGGDIQFNLPGSGYKYIFYGSGEGNILDSAQWLQSLADSAGMPPATLGYVNSSLNTATISHTLSLPCCGPYLSNQRRTAPNKLKPLKRWLQKGVADPAPQGINVYPNPANTALNFEFPASGDVAIKITDVTGRLMDEQVVHDGTRTSFNVSGYTPGVYIYQVVTNGKVQAGKVVIRR